MGFSGGSHDRLRVSEVERIRWTVGTAEGAAVGHQRWRTQLALNFKILESYFVLSSL